MLWNYLGFNPFSFLSSAFGGSSQGAIINQTQVQIALNIAINSSGVYQFAQNIGTQTAYITQ